MKKKNVVDSYFLKLFLLLDLLYEICESTGFHWRANTGQSKLLFSHISRSDF